MTDHQVRVEGFPVTFLYNPVTGRVTVDAQELVIYLEALESAEPENTTLQFLRRWLDSERANTLRRVATHKADDGEFGMTS